MPVATGKDVPTRPAGCFDTRRLRVHVLTLAPTDHNTQRMVFLGCRTDEDRPMVCCHAMVMPPIPDLRTAPYLDWIEVGTEYRREGFGRELVEGIERYLGAVLDADAGTPEGEWFLGARATWRRST